MPNEMNIHYLTTSHNNPHFYVFALRMQASLDGDDVAHLSADWKQLQITAWVEFWEREGHELLEKKWHKLNPHYKERITSATFEEAAAWKELWTQHACEVGDFFWHIFSCAFENYEKVVNKSFYANQKSIEEVTIDLCQLDIDLNDTTACQNLAAERSTSDEDYLTANDDPDAVDDAQLKLFGLPTAFGNQAQKFRKLKPKRVQYIETDSDSDSNMPKNKNEHEPLHGVQSRVIRKRKLLERKLANPNLPDFMHEDKSMLKYWFKRFSLFSRFDLGIQLDRESWFSVTPEKIAKHTASRLACDIIVDGFCGCGGNAIQFALTCGQVIAVDIDAEKLAMAKHNATIYGVAHKIQFVHADFLQFARSTSLRADVVFLSPPWGGPAYLKLPTYDIEQCLQPLGATDLMRHARRLSDNVGFFLPRNANIQQVIRLACVGQQCEVQHNYLDTRLVALTAYYGEKLIKPQEQVE